MHKDFWNNGAQYNKDNVFKKRKDITSDSDAAIILPLILILMSDGGDEMLIMALIYILS